MSRHQQSIISRLITLGLWAALGMYAAALLIIAHLALEETAIPEPVTDCYVFEDDTWGCFYPGDDNEPVGRVPVWTGKFDDSPIAYEVWTQGGDLG